MISCIKYRYKRSLLAGVFLCLFACGPQVPDNPSSDAQSLPTPSQVDSSVESAKLPPLLTLSELMSASDFRQGIKQAYLDSDENLMAYWQEQALLVAVEARLPQSDIELLSGRQGLLYLEYEAKKEVFNEEFAKRFIEFESVDSLFERFPNLGPLHKKARALVVQRDKLVAKAAQVLTEDGFSGDALLQAKEQWKSYMVDSGNINLILGLPVAP